MGNQNQNTEREGLKRSKKCKETKKMLQFLSCATILSLSVGAPQYGGVQPCPPVKTAPLTGSIQCRTEYTTLWDTEYKETETEVCTTEYEKVCRTETQRLCQPTTRQECSTEYKEDCEYQWEGHGNDKVWAPIAGTCKSNPYETCSDVTKSKAVQVPYPVCRDIPEQKCVDVPRQECVQVPDQVCTNQPLQKCQDVPRQACQQIHKKVPNRVSRRVPQKVCQDSGSHLDGVAGGSRLVVIDARKNEKAVQFEEGVETPNSIVFGD